MSLPVGQARIQAAQVPEPQGTAVAGEAVVEAAVAVGGGGVVVVLQGVGVGQSPGQGGASIRLLGSKKNNTFLF